MNEEQLAAAVRDIRTRLLWAIKRAGYAKTQRDRKAELHEAYAFARSLDILQRKSDLPLPDGYEEWQVERRDFDAAIKYLGAEGEGLLGKFSEYSYVREARKAIGEQSN